MNYSDLKELSPTQLNELYLTSKDMIEKSIILSLLELEWNDDLINEVKENPDFYYQEIKPLLNNSNYKQLLPPCIELLLVLIKDQNQYADSLIEDIFNTTSFNNYPEHIQHQVVDTLIAHNKLQASNEFIQNKISKNLLISKLNTSNEVQYSFGLKEIDKKLLTAIGQEFNHHMELGWVNNNGDREEFRTSLKDFLVKLNSTKILTFIREDNHKAITLMMEFSFRKIKTIKSPYSQSKLIVLEL